MLNRLTNKVAGEWLLGLSLIGLIISSIYLHRFPAYDKTDFKVIYILFIFLVIIKGLERTNLLHIIAYKFKTKKWLSQKLILLTAILSIFITNDVALLTVVPLTLSMEINNVAILIILETITANGVSALTPFGNPQNIFIYLHYHLHPLMFIKTIAPFSFISLVFVLLIAQKKAKITYNNSGDNSNNILNPLAYGYLVLFFSFIMALLKILPLYIGLLALVYAIFFDKKSLGIDWVLLITFLAFFGFTDNIEHLLKISIDNPLEAFLYPAIGSQIISNVPGALFFADFTCNWKALLWGVSVGGFGSLMGSLASLISFRLYKAKKKKVKKFVIEFHVYNYIAFFIGILTYLLINWIGYWN